MVRCPLRRVTTISVVSRAYPNRNSRNYSEGASETKQRIECISTLKVIALVSEVFIYEGSFKGDIISGLGYVKQDGSRDDEKFWMGNLIGGFQWPHRRRYEENYVEDEKGGVENSGAFGRIFKGK